MTRYPRWRIALYAALLIGSAGAASGPARLSSAAGAGMPMAQAGAARAPGGTTVQLHRRLVRVTIVNFAFQPARLIVSPGTRIIWTNRDSDPHTVDSTTHLWTSVALDTDDRFARIFTKAGMFPYYCSVHPYMHGVIIVRK